MQNKQEHRQLQERCPASQPANHPDDHHHHQHGNYGGHYTLALSRTNDCERCATEGLVFVWRINSTGTLNPQHKLCSASPVLVNRWTVGRRRSLLLPLKLTFYSPPPPVGTGKSSSSSGKLCKFIKCATLFFLLLQLLARRTSDPARSSR